MPAADRRDWLPRHCLPSAQQTDGAARSGVRACSERAAVWNPHIPECQSHDESGIQKSSRAYDSGTFLIRTFQNLQPTRTCKAPVLIPPSTLTELQLKM